MRRLTCFVLLIALTACSRPPPARAPFVESRLPPDVESRYWPPGGWAWGLLKVPGRPAQRYGVSAAPAIPRAEVVIMTGYGESAEMWFETAGRLNRAGYTVWVLEGVGQGGSERLTAPRDLGHLTDGEADGTGLNLFLRIVVRPPPRQEVVVIASGTAWLSAVAAFEKSTPAVRLVLSGPLSPPTPATTGRADARAAGGAAWVRPAPNLPRRQLAALSWALANPDLRMGGPSNGWFFARDSLAKQALDPSQLKRVGAPIAVLTPTAGSTPCVRMTHCVEVSLAASVPYHQAPDADFEPWFKALLAALADDHPA